MPTNILMPALSPTMEKGNLARWLKKEGDKIKSGDVIAEIETDKATMEYEAVDEGTLAKIVVPEGTQDVAVNAVHRGAGGRGRGREGGGRWCEGRAEAAQRSTGAKRQSRKLRHRKLRPPRAAAPSALRRRTCAARMRRQAGRIELAAIACFPRRSRAASPKRPASICARIGLRPARPGDRARHRGRQIRQGPARPGRRDRACAGGHADRAHDVGQADPRRCTKRAATTSCRTTACAAPSRSA